MSAIRWRSRPSRCARWPTAPWTCWWTCSRTRAPAPPCATPRRPRCGSASRPRRRRPARPYGELLDQLRDDVLPYMSRCDHPGYFAFVPACGTFPGALGDFIASALNIYAGSWMESAGPSQLELTVIDWFKEWIGYPDEAAGAPRVRRVGGQPDRAGLRARIADRVDARGRGGLRLRPVALVGRASGAHPRLPPRPDAGAADRPRVPHAPRRTAPGHRCRPRGRPGAAGGVRQRGQHQHRGHRPDRRAGRDLPRARVVAPRRRRLRRTGRAHRAGPPAGWRASSWPTRSRSTRTSGSTSPSSAARVLVRDGSLLRRAFRIAPDYLQDVQRMPARSTSPTTGSSSRGCHGRSRSGSR